MLTASFLSREISKFQFSASFRLHSLSKAWILVWQTCVPPAWCSLQRLTPARCRGDRPVVQALCCSLDQQSAICNQNPSWIGMTKHSLESSIALGWCRWNMVEDSSEEAALQCQVTWKVRRLLGLPFPRLLLVFWIFCFNHEWILWGFFSLHDSSASTDDQVLSFRLFTGQKISTTSPTRSYLPRFLSTQWWCCELVFSHTA